MTPRRGPQRGRASGALLARRTKPARDQVGGGAVAWRVQVADADAAVSEAVEEGAALIGEPLHLGREHDRLDTGAPRVLGDAPVGIEEIRHADLGGERRAEVSVGMYLSRVR